MSLPTFPKPGEILSREDAVNAVISSIAMEEAALSHILNAEGEKIQYVLEKEKNSENPDLNMILAVNKSVESLVEHINDAQIILKNKLNLATSILPHHHEPHHHEPEPLKPPPPPVKPPCPEPPPPVKPPCPEPPPPVKPPCPEPPPPVKPPCPEPPPVKPPPFALCYPDPQPFCPPCPKPKPPCPEPPPQCLDECNPHSYVFAVPCGHNWACESTLCLEERKCFSDCGETYPGVKKHREHRETYIMLPGSMAYEVGLELELINQSASPVSIEATLVCNTDEVLNKTYSFEVEKQNIHIRDKIKIPFRNWAGKFSVRLLSPKSILVKGGGISVYITGRR